MYHQLTLEDLGMVPKQKKIQEHISKISNTVIPCGDCICNHCSNNVECYDNCTGEMIFPCFTCDECRCFDGRGRYNWRTECEKYRITEAYAKKMRKNIRAVMVKE
jgi:hypothetical protein